MNRVDKLVKLTYDKIFFEGLHFLSSDLEVIKQLILKNQKLLTDKVDQTLFIYDLAEKLKQEKLEEGLQQKKRYGQVLMYNFEKIQHLYYWLYNLNDKKDKRILKIWIKEDADLKKLASYLESSLLIESSEDFYNVLINSDLQKMKVNWIKTKTLLIYLIEKLKEKGFVNAEVSENLFIESSFLLKGCYISNIKQSKNGKKNNINSKPQQFYLIDEFFKE